MKMLPYTFMALLTADQLLNLLEKADDDAIRCLPLDGVLACALYHLKCSIDYMQKVYIILYSSCTAFFFVAAHHSLNWDWV